MSDFEYDGSPKPGETPANDSDLHTSGNPFGAVGSPAVDLARASQFPLGSPADYYVNPPITVTTNPYAAGAGHYTTGAHSETALTDDVASGLTADVEHVLSNMTGGTSPAASADPASVSYDEGYSESGTGRS